MHLPVSLVLDLQDLVLVGLLDMDGSHCGFEIFSELLILLFFFIPVILKYLKFVTEISELHEWAKFFKNGEFFLNFSSFSHSINVWSLALLSILQVSKHLLILSIVHLQLLLFAAKSFQMVMASYHFLSRCRPLRGVEEINGRKGCEFSNFVLRQELAEIVDLNGEASGELENRLIRCWVTIQCECRLVAVALDRAGDDWIPRLPRGFLEFNFDKCFLVSVLDELSDLLSAPKVLFENGCQYSVVENDTKLDFP